jgi:hypothetical protein
LLLLLAPLLAGCAGASDFLSKDAEWFSRPSRVFNRTSLALETPPLTPVRAVTPDDLISAEGYCSGMTPQSDAIAATDSTSAPTGAVGGMSAGIALGQTECEVARFAGAPDNVNLSNNERGDRDAVLTYLKGPRPGIYHFTGGRLSEIDAVPAPAAPAKPTRARHKKRNG